MPVSLARTSTINGLQSSLDQPEFITAMGLVRFGSLRQKRRAPSRMGNLRDTISSLFKVRRNN